MKNIALAAVVGGLLAWVWGAISWTVLPWHNASMSNLPNETTIVESLKTSSLNEGVYRIPGHPYPSAMTEAEEAAWMEKAKTGPVGLLFLYPGGADMSDPMPFITGLALNIVIAAILAYLVFQAAGTLNTFGKRLTFVFLAGVAIALATHITQWNWGMGPATWTLTMAADTIITWLIAGLAIAFFVKTPAAATNRS